MTWHSLSILFAQFDVFWFKLDFGAQTLSSTFRNLWWYAMVGSVCLLFGHGDKCNFLRNQHDLKCNIDFTSWWIAVKKLVIHAGQDINVFCFSRCLPMLHITMTSTLIPHLVSNAVHHTYLCCHVSFLPLSAPLHPAQSLVYPCWGVFVSSGGRSTFVQQPCRASICCI